MNRGISEQRMIEPSMRKFSDPLLPSPQYSSIPQLNGSVTNIRERIGKWRSFQPGGRTLFFEDCPFIRRRLNRSTPQRCPLLVDREVPKGDHVRVSGTDAVLIPLSRTTAPEIEDILRESGPRRILFDSEFKGVLASIRPRLNVSNRDYISMGGLPSSHPCFFPQGKASTDGGKECDFSIRHLSFLGKFSETDVLPDIRISDLN